MTLHRTWIFLLLACFAVAVFAQQPGQEKPITWSVTAESQSKGPLKVNTYCVVSLKATVKPGWHLYATDFTPNGGPKPTVFDFSGSEGVKFIDPDLTYDMVFPEVKEGTDAVFGTKLRWWDSNVYFGKQFQVTDPAKAVIKVKITFMGCNDQTCLPPQTVTFTKRVKESAK